MSSNTVVYSTMSQGYKAATVAGDSVDEIISKWAIQNYSKTGYLKLLAILDERGEYEYRSNFLNDGDMLFIAGCADCLKRIAKR